MEQPIFFLPINYRLIYSFQEQSTSQSLFRRSKMPEALHVQPLTESLEKQFASYLDEDRVLHIFTIYDLRRARDKTEVWLALRQDRIASYLFEYDKRIVHAHGDAEGVPCLLRVIDINEPIFIIEPQHLAAVEKVFEPVQPTDSASKGRITTYYVMTAKADTFRPLIKHRVKKLNLDDLDEVSRSLGAEYRERAETAVQRGMAFGAYENETLVSLATVPEILEEAALIRGVYTAPSLRSRGLATSACSALAVELMGVGKTPVLWVAEDNIPARKVYEKIGFERTEHKLLGFKARRR